MSYNSTFIELFKNLVKTSRRLIRKQNIYERANTALNPNGTLKTLQTTLNSGGYDIFGGTNNNISFTNDGLEIVSTMNPDCILRINGAQLSYSTDGGSTFDNIISVFYDVDSLGNPDNKIGIHSQLLRGNVDFEQFSLDGGLDNSSFCWNKTGIKSWDATNTSRFCRFDKSGIRLTTDNGATWTTIIDYQGHLQTWSENVCENLDNTHPISLYFYLPPSLISVKSIILSFKRLNFRAYESGASSGGGSTQTSSSGGSSTPTSSSGGGETVTSDSRLNGMGVTDYIDVHTTLVSDETGQDGGHDHTGSVNSTTINMGIVTGTQLSVYGGGYTTWNPGPHNHSLVAESAHDHDLRDHRHNFNLNNISHSHNVTTNSHNHTVTINSHTHDLVLPSHSHSLTFGIYESLQANNISIMVDGVPRLGPYASDQTSLDLTSWISSAGWHEIQLSSTILGRLQANLFIQAYLSA